MALLVLVVDRDDDVGVKAGVETPVVGREEVLRAAEALLLADPEDSDGNTMFAAVKVYDELKSKGIDADIAVVSGDPHLGLVADMRIRAQLEKLFKKQYDGVVFVSDGAEDDQVIPIVSSFAPIVSKRTVIVKQAQQLEKTFYTLKTALSDPTFARLFLGVPGIVLLLLFFLKEEALRIITGVLGFYLVLKGFGLEEPLLNTLKTLFSFNPRSPSLPFHVAAVVILFGGILLSVHTYAALGGSEGLYEAIRFALVSMFLSVLSLLTGKTLEALHEKKAYLVGDYVLFGGTALVALLVADATLNFFEGAMSALDVAAVLLFATILYFAVIRVSGWIKSAPLRSKRVVGAQVFDRTGIRLGRVREIRGDHIIVEKGKRRMRVPLSRVRITGNKLVVV